MKGLILSLSLLVLIGGPAIAQSGKSTGTPTGGEMKSTMPQAPVGHRQPRASDVPDEGNLTDPNDPLSKQLTKENKALDRKVKSICRGC
jgi:hypothetical protein